MATSKTVMMKLTSCSFIIGKEQVRRVWKLTVWSAMPKSVIALPLIRKLTYALYVPDILFSFKIHMRIIGIIAITCIFVRQVPKAQDSFHGPFKFRIKPIPVNVSDLKAHLGRGPIILVMLGLAKNYTNWHYWQRQQCRRHHLLMRRWTKKKRKRTMYGFNVKVILSHWQTY